MGDMPERIWVEVTPIDIGSSDGPFYSVNGRIADIRWDGHHEFVPATTETALRAEVDALKAERDEARSRFNDIDLCRMASAPCDMLLRSYEENERLRGLLDEARDGLITIDALDPEAMISACSDAAARGLVLHMGNIARATLAKIGGAHD
jgi:hypothetical protein